MKTPAKPRTRLPPHVVIADGVKRSLATFVERALDAGCDPGMLAQILEAAAARLVARKPR